LTSGTQRAQQKIKIMMIYSFDDLCSVKKQ